MKKNLPSVLVATAATSAAPFTVSQATAQDLNVSQDTIDYRVNLAFEGGAFLSESLSDDKAGALDKLGNSDTMPNMYAAVSYTRMIDPGLDWRIAGAVNFAHNSEGLLSFDVPGTMVDITSENKFNFQTVDFDLGKRVQSGNAEVRFFAGLRGIHSKETSGFGFNVVPDDPLVDKASSVDKVGTSEFWGIGPRLGAETSVDVGNNVYIVGSASAAAMWGRRSNDLNFSLSSFDPFDVPPETEASVVQSTSSSEVVTNFAIDGGLSWEFMPGKMVTGGYRLDHWRNLRSFDEEHFTTHGPFLRLNVKM